MARKFSKAQRQAAAIVQGVSLDGMHADHIKPFSAGGKTTVENCQILTPEANLAKGSNTVELRKWQQLFLDKWDIRESAQPFLLVAIPGGGKTFAAITAAKRWRLASPDRKLIVVVPSDTLRRQWKNECALYGIQLQSKEFDGFYKEGFDGIVTTYSTVSRSPLLFRKLTSVAPAMVIFDEIHHCGDDAIFGKAVREAFELSSEKLLLSGTPWRTPGTPIPFVRYDGDGFCKSDHRYDYPEALEDNVVRYLAFFYDRGSITFDATGEVWEVNKDISDTDAKERLRRLLDPGGEFVRDQIRKAHAKLLDLRRTVRDAAAMAACIDQWHAQRVAEVIEAETGCKPSLIISDTEYANDCVEDFSRGNSEWLVSVRQVSEGADIKRLQVLCYFTNWVTELFFRQLIGRVSRIRELEDYESYVYLPADPRLIRFAENIENAQLQHLKEESKKQAAEMAEREQREFDFEPYSTSHLGTDVVLIGNATYSRDAAAEIERIHVQEGVSMELVARILEASRSSNPRPVQKPTVDRPNLEDRMDRLRGQCKSKAFRLASLRGVDIREIHGRFKPQKDMTEMELIGKLKSLNQAISEFIE